jgi:hypothetical protein
LWLEQGVILTSFKSNVFKENSEAGILLNADNVASLDMNSVFTNGNGSNVVEIHGIVQLSKNVTAEVVWQGFQRQNTLPRPGKPDCGCKLENYAGRDH